MTSCGLGGDVHPGVLLTKRFPGLVTLEGKKTGKQASRAGGALIFSTASGENGGMAPNLPICVRLLAHIAHSGRGWKDSIIEVPSSVDGLTDIMDGGNTTETTSTTLNTFSAHLPYRLTWKLLEGSEFITGAGAPSAKVLVNSGSLAAETVISSKTAVYGVAGSCLIIGRQMDMAVCDLVTLAPPGPEWMALAMACLGDAGRIKGFTLDHAKEQLATEISECLDRDDLVEVAAAGGDRYALISLCNIRVPVTILVLSLAHRLLSL